MQFKTDASETNGQDIVSAINDYCDSDATSYPIASKVRNSNIGYEKLIGRILGSDGLWQWDDTNYTTVPRGTGTLVEGQEQYAFAAEYLEIEHIDILTTTAGVWRRLKPLDRAELGDMTTEEYFGVTSAGNPATGFPIYYDKEGDSIRLYPAPTSTAVTLASGLRVSFKRTADLFTVTDTTQEPGLPSPYHNLIAVWASIPYCKKYKKDRVPELVKEWDEGIKEMLAFFGRREKDRRKIMTMGTINYI